MARRGARPVGKPGWAAQGLRSPAPIPIFSAPSQPLERLNVKAGDPAYLMAVTTVPSVDVGRALVKALVERRLVACGNILPGAVSIYRWKGAIEESAEAVVLLKTRAERWDALKAALPSLHPYEVPELILVPIIGGHQPYLDWLAAET